MEQVYIFFNMWIIRWLSISGEEMLLEARQDGFSLVCCPSENPAITGFVYGGTSH